MHYAASWTLMCLNCAQPAHGRSPATASVLPGPPPGPLARGASSSRDAQQLEARE